MESTEPKKRLGEYINKIDLENPDMDTFNKSIKLARLMTELDDMECINLFARTMRKTAKKRNNKEIEIIADQLSKLTAKEIQRDDQRGSPFA